MHVTVCELPDAPDAFQSTWKKLASHLADHHSDLLLLPELPAPPWFCSPPETDPETWQQTVQAHQELISNLTELPADEIILTRPIERGGRRVNEAIAWSSEGGARAIHEKRFLPDEPGWHEARWYQPGTRPFQLAEVAGAWVGTLVCTDVMFNEHARTYGRQRAELIVVPRASEGAPRWQVACSMAAVASGAYVLSSNRSGPGHVDEAITWGGEGMVVDPEGVVLASTDAQEPFVTVELDLEVARAAKESYPRYVRGP